MQPVIETLTATADPPPSGVPNPIHDADGADSAGYAGALVSGVRTYGWVAHTIARALGDDWVNSGWVDFTLRRPLYADEKVTIEVTSDAGTWRLVCSAGEGENRRIVLDGSAGLGEAAWTRELNPPQILPARPQPDELGSYDLDTVPLRQPLNPLTEHLSTSDAKAMVSDDLGLDDARYLDVDPPAPVHPYYLAGRISPLTRHNFIYGPTIHVRSQIQHQREGRADRDIPVGAQIVDAYDRKGHWYQVLDSVVSDPQGVLSLIRHHTIFRPRGT